VLYLNRIYLGAGAYGVDSAARAYFRRPARSRASWRPTRAHPANLVAPKNEIGRDYSLDAAAQEVKSLVSFASSDLTIDTTMQTALQDAGPAAIRNVLYRDGKSASASRAALLAMTEDGPVRALVGGRDYARSAFNRATDAHYQPDSAFKPFVYPTALENSLDPNTMRVDQPVTIGEW
jgi:penicillin-binding protein 1A